MMTCTLAFWEKLNDEETMKMITDYGLQAIIVLVVFLTALIVAGWTGSIVRAICTRAKLDETLGKFFARMARWAVLILSVLMILGRFGFQTASFAVVIGSAGLAVGLAMQGTLSNFAAGVMLLAFRPFKVGDVVNVAGETGKVDEIDLFSTTMDTPDNRRIILPNGSIFGANITCITHHPTRRVDVNVGVDYSAGIDRTREVLMQAANNVEGRLHDPEPAIILTELGASSVDWQVRVWANTPDFFDVRQATIRQVKLALDEAGIGIPFPQMDVHVDGEVKSGQ